MLHFSDVAFFFLKTCYICNLDTFLLPEQPNAYIYIAMAAHITCYVVLSP